MLYHHFLHLAPHRPGSIDFAVESVIAFTSQSKEQDTKLVVRNANDP